MIRQFKRCVAAITSGAIAWLPLANSLPASATEPARIEVVRVGRTLPTLPHIAASPWETVNPSEAYGRALEERFSLSDHAAPNLERAEELSQDAIIAGAAAGTTARGRPLGGETSAIAEKFALLFDNFLAKYGATSVNVAARVTRPDTGQLAKELQIMHSSHLLSRVMLVQRRGMAPSHLSGDAVRAIAARNYDAAARFVVNHAHELPLSSETAAKIYALLANELVPDFLQGEDSFLHHGGEKFQREVLGFFEWLQSQRGHRALLAAPVEMSQRVHYFAQFFDVAPEFNGVLARLLMDFALLKAGLAPALYRSADAYYTKGVVRARTSVADALALHRETVAEGQRAMSGPDLAPAPPTASEQLLAVLAAQPQSVGAERRRRVSWFEFAAVVQALRAESELMDARFFKRVWLSAKRLPSSLKQLALSSGIAVGVAMGAASVIAYYGLKEFDLAWGMAALVTNQVTRIISSVFLAPRIKSRAEIAERSANPAMKKWDPARVYFWAMLLTSVQLMALPIGYKIFGHGSTAYLSVFIVTQALYGLINGATVGVLDGMIVKYVVGDDPGRIGTANFVWGASREFGSFVTVVFVASLLDAFFGPETTLFALACIQLLSAYFARNLKYAPSSGKKSESMVPGAASANLIGIRDLVPFALVRFVPTAVLSFFTGLLTLLPGFGSKFSHWAIAAFISGRMVATLYGSLFKLALSWLPRMPSGASLLLKVSPHTWYGLLSAAMIAYLMTGAIGVSLPVAIAIPALLGFLCAFADTQFRSLYMQGFSDTALARAYSRTINWSILPSILPALVIAYAHWAQWPIITTIQWIATASAAWVALLWGYTRITKPRREAN